MANLAPRKLRGIESRGHDRGGVTARRSAGAGGLSREHRAGRSLEVRLVDSHTHLDDHRFGDDRDAVVQRAVDAGVTRSFRSAQAKVRPTWRRRSESPSSTSRCMRAWVCIPSMRRRSRRRDYDRLATLLHHPKVLLVGEIGLDYYWKPYDAKLQADVFVQQMQIAARRGSRSASIRETPGTTRSRCFDRTGRRPGCRASCTASPAIPSRRGRRWTWVSTELLRCGDLPEGNGRSRVRQVCSAGSHPGGDRCSVPCAGSVSRQAQRAFVCCVHTAQRVCANCEG